MTYSVTYEEVLSSRVRGGGDDLVGGMVMVVVEVGQLTNVKHFLLLQLICVLLQVWEKLLF